MLAGGENRRFLSHKSLAEIKLRRIIERTLELLVKHFKAVHISTNTSEFFLSRGTVKQGYCRTAETHR